MLSSDAASPVDRPNLSKDYLAGNAPEDWMPLRPDSFYSEAGIELRLNTNVTAIDAKARHVVTADGGKVAYDRLLLATGAEPVHLPFPGADQQHVHPLRSLADCRAIIEAAKETRQALVIGASFIRTPRLRQLYALAKSRCTWWRRKNAQWSESSGRKWAISFVHCTRSTGSSFILKIP